MTEEYADASYITYGSGCDMDENKRKKEKAVELYGQLLDMCADALKSTNDNEGAMKLIDQVLVYYRYAGGKGLFLGQSGGQFYRDLLIRATKKEENESKER